MLPLWRRASRRCGRLFVSLLLCSGSRWRCRSLAPAAAHVAGQARRRIPPTTPSSSSTAVLSLSYRAGAVDKAQNHGPLPPPPWKPHQGRRRTALAASSEAAAAAAAAASTRYLARLNATLSFPISCAELLEFPPGHCVTSETFTLHAAEEDTAAGAGGSGEHSYDFCVHLYPRGVGAAKKSPFGTNNNNTKGGGGGGGGGFGMSYAMVPPALFAASGSTSGSERVYLYLQFLPRRADQTVDASFALRLVGRQSTGRRFDVEWRAGMRFVAAGTGKLAEGRASDFGAPLLPTGLLPIFWGADSAASGNGTPTVHVELQLHARPATERRNGRAAAHTNNTASGGFRPLRDIRRDVDNDDARHDTEAVRVGRIVVPVVSRLADRPRLMALGAYPGVEYRILRIHDDGDGGDLFYSQPGALYDIKPIYPLVRQLERTWPITVRESDLPTLYTPGMYNAVSAIGSLLTAATGLLTAFVLSQAVSLFYIPSRSMDPTLAVGDVLLVEKISPRGWGNYRTGDVVLFAPPARLREIVAQSGGRRLTRRDLFVKRIAAEPGDVVRVNPSGRVEVNGRPAAGRRDRCDAEPLGLIQNFLPAAAAEFTVPKGTLEVLGDCGSVSIDSRVWGPLPKENVIGRPVLRLWPLSQFGPVPALADGSTEDRRLNPDL